jgi:RNA polymerase sigma-70 factor (ECF subfamily)
MRTLRALALAGVLLPAAGLAARAAEEITLASSPRWWSAQSSRAGAADVPASTTEIRVTFSRPMRNGDWSWVKLSDASFPKIAGNPRFLEDQRTCVLAVSLEPGKTYAIWLNQPPHENLQDPQGHKAVPYLLVFETKR